MKVLQTPHPREAAGTLLMPYFQRALPPGSHAFFVGRNMVNRLLLPN